MNGPTPYVVYFIFVIEEEVTTSSSKISKQVNRRTGCLLGSGLQAARGHVQDDWSLARSCFLDRSPHRHNFCQPTCTGLEWGRAVRRRTDRTKRTDRRHSARRCRGNGCRGSSRLVRPGAAAGKEGADNNDAFWSQKYWLKIHTR